MGFHLCEYITSQQAEELGLRNRHLIRSSGDVFMTFSSGRSWTMPDMAPLYIELGWVPPAEFIKDIMTNQLTAGIQVHTFSQPNFVPIGYLNPQDNPLPLKMSSALPPGFLEKLETRMKEASTIGIGGPSGRIQKRGPKKPPGPAV